MWGAPGPHYRPKTPRCVYNQPISRRGVYMRVLILFLISGAAAMAQTASTQILGLVTDASGAVVPNAVVTATRVETGDVRTTSSNDTGNYIFPLVDSGS